MEFNSSERWWISHDITEYHPRVHRVEVQSFMDFPQSVPKAPEFVFFLIGFHFAHVARVGTCAGVKAVAWSSDGRKLATGGAGS